jgi:hypothetical protein
MSPVKVTRDGKLVNRIGGEAAVGLAGRKVVVGFSSIHTAGTVLRDEEVAPELLELVKDGEVRGLDYYEDEEEARSAPIPGSPEAQPPQNEPELNPANDGGGDGDDGSEAGQDDLFDPDQHNQAAVLEYLKTASPEEVERVKAVEASGQGRQQIGAFKVPEEPADDPEQAEGEEG